MDFRAILLLSVVLLEADSAYNSYCGDNFQVVGQTYCYYVSQVKVRWYRAFRECYRYNAQLFRAYDSRTLAEVVSLLNGTAGTRWWTGLNDYKTVGEWRWGISSRASSVDFSVIKWIKEPDEANHRQNCAALNFQGSLSDERCWDRHRYICEYTNTPGTACAESWTSYKNGCYLFPSGLRDPFSMLTWNKAREKCVNASSEFTGISNVQTHLLQLETQDELDYIRQQLPKLTLTAEIWWIGLNDSSNEGQWKWLDGTPLQNAIWAQEPNNLGGKERCGYMNAAGQFGDLSCNNSERYICMKENDASTVSNMSLGCPASWLRAGHYCYHAGFHRTSWYNASVACQSLGSSLVKVDDLDKKTWIENQNGLFSRGRWYWTGLNRQGTTWLWADNSPANLSLVKWHQEPNNYKGSEDCAVIFKGGTFNDVNCLIQAGFICEQNSEDAPCPTGWLTINKQDHSNCYYISNTTANFDEAHAQCNQLSFPTTSYLVAFNTKQELTFIQQQIKSQTSSIDQWYTGLTDSGHEGFWTYDTSFNPAPASGFIPWSSMPEFVDGDENCVVVMWGGDYINWKCNDKRSYLCERPVAGFSVNAGSKVFLRKFSISSVFILAMYFVVYALCLHYILHLTYVLFPAYA